MAFDAQSTTDDVLEGVDLSGRTALVTGASGGLGLETARALAAHGAEVVLAARDPQKLDAAAATLRSQGVAGTVSTLVVDLASLDSVRAAAEEAVAQHPAIEVLVDNAGVMACPLSRTADGFEMQLGTNHLGHFLLTNLLLDSLRGGVRRSGGARVVVLSSGGHRTSPILWDDPNFERTDYFNFTAYGQSKTANALFALEFDRRVGPEGIHAWSVHPGVIATDLGRHLTPEDIDWMMSRPRRSSGSPDVAGSGESSGSSGFRFKSVEAGAATSVWAATAPELLDTPGVYLEDCRVAEPVDDPDRLDGVHSWARDPDQAERLWTLSEQLVGLSPSTQRPG